MSSPDRIPVAVIGVGRMGKHHARVYRSLPGAELVAVVDADEERGAMVAEEFGCAPLADVDELLTKFPRVKAVTVARIDGPSTIDEGSVYQLNLSASGPEAAGIVRWTIDWGDGTIETFAGSTASVGTPCSRATPRGASTR